MIKFKTFISEAIDNLFIKDRVKREQYIDQIWDLLQKNYAKIGGIHGNGFNSKEEIITKIPMLKIFRQGEEVKAVICYKDSLGRKSVALGTDGSVEGKRMAANMKVADLSTGRMYGEVSGNSLFFLIKSRKKDFINDIISYKDAIKRVGENGDTIKHLSLDDQRNFIDEIMDFFHAPDVVKLGMSKEDINKLIKTLTNSVYSKKIGNEYHTKVMIGSLSSPNIVKK